MFVQNIYAIREKKPPPPVFGSDAYIHVSDKNRRKLDHKARQLFFMGYSEDQKAYRFLDPATNRVTICRDAQFLKLVAGVDQEEESGSGAVAAPKEVIVSFITER